MKRLFCLLFLFSLSAFTFPRQSEVGEYNLKAVFIYNFTKYISWDAFPQKNEFIIGVIGSSPIIDPLGEIAQTKKVGNKKIVIRKFRDPQDISFCNILFISRHNNYALSSIMQKLSLGTLTVGEDEGLASEGVAFNFIIEDSKVKFEANLGAITSAGLKASSELLQHAIIVEQR